MDEHNCVVTPQYIEAMEQFLYVVALLVHDEALRVPPERREHIRMIMENYAVQVQRRNTELEGAQRARSGV